MKNLVLGFQFIKIKIRILGSVPITPKQNIMITKKYNAKGTQCKVTFALPKEFAEAQIAVVGDFNGWNSQDGAMKFVKKDQQWKASVNLAAGERIEFRYVGDKGWYDDSEADEVVEGPFFAMNSVLLV